MYNNFTIRLDVGSDHVMGGASLSFIIPETVLAALDIPKEHETRREFLLTIAEAIKKATVEFKYG